MLFILIISIGTTSFLHGTINWYTKASAIPSLENTLSLTAEALFDLGKYKAAIFIYDKILFIDPNNEAILYNKGAALDSLGNHTQAISYYDKALAIDPNYKNALTNKGLSPHALEIFGGSK